MTPNELKDTLWKAANKLRGSLSSSQYKDVILGLVFLKHISDAALEVRWRTTSIVRHQPADSTRRCRP